MKLNLLKRPARIHLYVLMIIMCAIIPFMLGLFSASLFQAREGMAPGIVLGLLSSQVYFATKVLIFKKWAILIGIAMTIFLLLITGVINKFEIFDSITYKIFKGDDVLSKIYRFSLVFIMVAIICWELLIFLLPEGRVKA
jgi:hypothetical protein